MQDTKNIKLVAYLRFLDRHPDKVEKISRGKARYFFKMTESEWDQVKLDFNRSEFIKYAACMDAVLDLAY